MEDDSGKNSAYMGGPAPATDFYNYFLSIFNSKSFKPVLRIQIRPENFSPSFSRFVFVMT